jgi:cobalt-precorrin 5A hydrolase
MGRDEMRIAIGIGCRHGCAGAAIVALVRRALMSAQCASVTASLYSHQDKQNEAGLIEAAKDLGLPLIFLDAAALRDAAPRALTHSAKVMAMFGLPSIAETAALAGAGPDSILLVPRINAAGASCAIAGTSET